ncbi:MAG: LytTR family DNA-binding domain-containing protein [Eubacterium sp.]
MRFAIVEDEPAFMKDLQSTLQIWKPVDIDIEIDSYYTGEEIVQRYRAEQKNYDIIFMDIKLGGIDGLTAANQLRHLGCDNAIVFTTNHTEFELMQKSYDVNALHYFEKPISVQNIESCIKKLNPFKKYSYTYKEKQILVPIKEIIYFESAKNYVTIHTLNSELEDKGKHRMTVNTLLDILPNRFVQCHRSFIVNIAHVILIKNKSLYVRTLPQKPLPIGESFLDGVLTAFQSL